MDHLKVFGRAVKLRRQELNLSQEELALISGLHRTYIGGIEQGTRNIGLSNIIKLSKALRLSPSELLSCFNEKSEI
ncbi:helix-turn-helix domain-containing protein [Planococcus dechangensis]|uniref:Helix-turn-helix domain-containing protein n=1 Tax=Planococcus dechangensis TaxID=1176255 RepID=A0ABV9MC97_9BACL